MNHPGHIHWSAHVSCAVAGVVAVSMLVVSDLLHVPSLGRWALLFGLLAAVIAAAITADRCARKLAVANDAQATALLTEVGKMMDRKAAEVMATYEGQTEEIAHAVCDAVMDVFDSRRGGDVRKIGR